MLGLQMNWISQNSLQQSGRNNVLGLQLKWSPWNFYNNPEQIKRMLVLISNELDLLEMLLQTERNRSSLGLQINK